MECEARTSKRPGAQEVAVRFSLKNMRGLVKVIVVANFEPGEDTGDAPGEFQLWAEREKLSEKIPIRGALRPLERNAAGLYGIVWGSPRHDDRLGQ
jgi:purine nucleoside permease